MSAFNMRWAVALGAVSFLALAQAQAQQTPATPAAPPAAAPAIEPKVAEILKAACAVLENAKAMSFNALSTYEKAARNGQPLFYATLNQVTMQRPDKLRVVSPGDGIPDEFYYNGKTMMAYVPSQDLVAKSEAPPTIDQMVDAAWEKAAIFFPFADVILSKPCAVFKERGMDTAFYVGQSKLIGGTITDIVAVASPEVQAELWIGAADHLPRLVRVVYPNEPAHALYQTEYSDWHLMAAVDPATFRSAMAEKAKPMQFEPPGPREQPPNVPPQPK
ncbi:MAG TPA: DUF2092 domain-containing protein [Stellaceae bacterium]|nr:DUF2092 domain-containing protein [Stellaceae bacterium]